MDEAKESKLKSEAEKTPNFDLLCSSFSPQTPADDDQTSEKDYSCTVQGPYAAATTFTVETKDVEGRNVVGAKVRVRVTGPGGHEQDGIVKDMGDGSYHVTYRVPEIGNYTVNVECNGQAIPASPLSVHFSSLVSGRVVLPEKGSQLGEICREYLNGRCASASCLWVHPPLETMTDAQTIVAAQALQAHAATQAQSAKHSSALGSSSLPQTLQTELATARDAKVRKKLLADGLVIEEKEPDKKSWSPSPTRANSRTRRTREYRSRSPVRSRHYSRERRSYRDISDKRRSRDLGRSHGNESPVFRRKPSRSPSPQTKKLHHDDIGSPSHRPESRTERKRSRRHVTKSSSSRDEGSKSRRRRRSLSKSDEVVNKRESRREDKSAKHSSGTSNQTMPIKPDYSGSADRAPPGLLAMIPRVVSAISRRLFFPEMVPQDGDICLESLHGLCASTSCKLVHPPRATSNIVPMTPSIVAAHQALQAHAATQAQSSKHSSEETASALALNNMEFGSRPLDVEMPKSLPPRPISNSALGSSSLPMSLRTVEIQKMQFQQSLLMQQTVTEWAAAIAAEIRKNVIVEKELDKKARSPSPTRAKSRARRSREYRSRSPERSRHYSRERRSYRDTTDKRRSRDLGISHGHRDDLGSPSHRPESRTERRRKSSRHHVTKSPSSGDEGSKSRRGRRSLSKSDEVVNMRESKRR